jgi:branched-chain amino acid transport system substrate-binding protein
VSEVEQLVQQNQVFALLSLTEYILPGSTNFLSTNQVPYYGWGFNPGFCGYRWGFGWNGCLSPVLLPASNPLHNVDEGNLATAIIKTSGLPASKVRFAVQAENSPSGTSGNADYDTLFKALGAKVVYSEANFPLTVTGIDFTPYVQAIMAAKPNIVFISTPFSRCRRHGVRAEGRGVQGHHHGLRHLLSGTAGLIGPTGFRLAG